MDPDAARDATYKVVLAKENHRPLGPANETSAIAMKISVDAGTNGEMKLLEEWRYLATPRIFRR